MAAILRVALPVPLDRLFDYRAADGVPVAPGSRVRVPFGRRSVVGVVIETATASTFDGERLKTAGPALDAEPLLDAELLATLGWAARYYQHPLGEAVNAALPVALRSARAAPEAGVAALRLTAAGAAARTDPARRRAPRLDALL
ncbi:MAG: primosomal protein N', partial [Rhodanobacteraceae bacterium]|nr:primosomal protein N' [Rhodanobacteraceae bacterium]